MLFWLNYILLPPHPLQPTPSLGIASNKFGFALAAPSVRTSAIQVNLMALGLASVGADEEVKGTAHGIKMQKIAEILPIL